MKIRALIQLLRCLNVKTIYFNFKFFPFSTAARLPVFLSNYVLLKDVSGKIELPKQFNTGMIKIGFGDVGIFDKKRSRTIWEVKGKVIFSGVANIGHGARICVGPDGVLHFGNHFNLTAESTIICYKNIVFGDYCLLSWEILMMDTDFHKIKRHDLVLNKDAPITIMDNVWIGARCLILKGSLISSGCVVAAGTLVNKPFAASNCILAGSPAKIVTENIEWTL